MYRAIDDNPTPNDEQRALFDTALALMLFLLPLEKVSIGFLCSCPMVIAARKLEK